MISSITSSVSTIVSSGAVNGLVLGLGLAATLTLIISLIIKELGINGISRWKVFGHNLDIITVPLLFVFCFIMLMMVVNRIV